MTSGEGRVPGIPPELVERAQNDTDYAFRLLSRESREEALREAGLDLSDDERSALNSRLDEIADLSFQEALAQLRRIGIPRFL